jgi:nucleotide-binding universal stress UspA family protein
MYEAGPVVVGIDDSPGTDLALRWGIARARAFGVSLRLVCAYEWALVHPWELAAEDVHVPELEQLRDNAGRLIEETLARATELAGELHIEAVATEGATIPVLVAESEKASVLVLGSRQLKTLGSVVLGSIAAGVSPRSSCPVVVLRGPVGDPAELAAVIVGVDGGEDSEPVLGFSFEHARRNRLPLRAVLCWQPNRLGSALWHQDQQSAERAESWLSEALAGWRERYPDVTVGAGVVRDAAVPALVAASIEQNLLVVGSRTRHALAGTLLGSVSQGVLHHAVCPVAVVPSAG